MHECIAQVCINFYYGTAGGLAILARHFLSDFKNSVPEYAVAIVATCVSYFNIPSFYSTFLQVFNCIDEYWQGYRQQRKFTGEGYRSTYESILEMITSIKGNQYHKEKWDRARRDWARRGM
jgi:hypothetical protein